MEIVTAARIRRGARVPNWNGALRKIIRELDVALERALEGLANESPPHVAHLHDLPDGSRIGDTLQVHRLGDGHPPNEGILQGVDGLAGAQDEWKSSNFHGVPTVAHPLPELVGGVELPNAQRVFWRPEQISVRRAERIRVAGSEDLGTRALAGKRLVLVCCRYLARVIALITVARRRRQRAVLGRRWSALVLRPRQRGRRFGVRGKRRPLGVGRVLGIEFLLVQVRVGIEQVRGRAGIRRPRPRAQVARAHDGRLGSAVPRSSLIGGAFASGVAQRRCACDGILSASQLMAFPDFSRFPTANSFSGGWCNGVA